MNDLVIVGSGPAGYTAAIYAARGGWAPLVLEGGVEMGGALMTTSAVENFPGFPEGVEGPDLVMGMRLQAERFGARFAPGEVVEVALAGEEKVVVDGDGKRHTARAVILAMGAAHRPLGLADEARLTGAGIHTCATCDAAFYQGSQVAVAGGGDSAMEEALQLSRFAERVTLLHRRDELRASQVLQDRVLGNPRIVIEWSRQVVDLRGGERLDQIEVADAAGDRAWRKVDALFVAIGHTPRTALVSGQVELDNVGYVAVADRTTRTSQAGVFAAGDVVDSRYRQAVTAAGMGCMAALDAERFLSGA